jgi:hypothetical protein
VWLILMSEEPGFTQVFPSWIKKHIPPCGRNDKN